MGTKMDSDHKETQSLGLMQQANVIDLDSQLKDLYNKNSFLCRCIWRHVFKMLQDMQIDKCLFWESFF